jgi:uncharacterized protein YdhG (YjbR/CyaY superfamily)
MPTPRNHDEYLAALPEAQRRVLQALRQTIRELAPTAEETISYQICAFRDGVMLVGYGATPRHCAFFLMSNQTTRTHAADLQGYDLSTGTIRFQPERPLPVALVRKLVKARQAENAARLAAKPKPASTKAASTTKASTTGRTPTAGRKSAAATKPSAPKAPARKAKPGANTAAPATSKHPKRATSPKRASRKSTRPGN